MCPLSVKPISVAFIIQTYHPHVGGAEQQLLNLLPLLQNRGLNTAVITRQLPGTSTKESINGTMVYRCPALPGKQLSSVSFTFYALYYLFKLKPDCIHAFQLLSPLTIAMLYRFFTKTPILCKVQSSGKTGDLDRIKSKLFTKLRFTLLKSNVDAYQVISKEIQDELKSINVPDNKLKYIPNGVVLSRYQPDTDDVAKKQLRKKLNILENELVFVALGRLVKKKNIPMLIDAWDILITQTISEPDLNKRKINIAPKLLIVGDGPDKQSLIQQAQHLPQVLFLGHRDDAQNVLLAADALIHVSTSEGQSNAINEAMACGLPIIATKTGAAEDQVQSGHNGWLVPLNDRKALVNAVLDAMENTEALPRMGANSRKLIEDQYDINVTADGLMDEYQRLVHAKQ